MTTTQRTNYMYAVRERRMDLVPDGQFEVRLYRGFGESRQVMDYITSRDELISGIEHAIDNGWQIADVWEA